MADNPYAAPRHQSVPDGLDQWPDIFVDGEFLVVKDGAVLPSRCILTNEPVFSGVQETEELAWLPSFRLVVSAKLCRVSYSINDAKKRKTRRSKFFVTACLGLAGLIATLFAENAILLVVFWILAAVAWGSRDPDLKVSAVCEDRFWLDGCGGLFLQACAAEFGARNR